MKRLLEIILMVSRWKGNKKVKHKRSKTTICIEVWWRKWTWYIWQRE